MGFSEWSFWQFHISWLILKKMNSSCSKNGTRKHILFGGLCNPECLCNSIWLNQEHNQSEWCLTTTKLQQRPSPFWSLNWHRVEVNNIFVKQKLSARNHHPKNSKKKTVFPLPNTVRRNGTITGAPVCCGALVLGQEAVSVVSVRLCS